MLNREVKRFALLFGVGVPPSTGLKEALQWLMMARLGVLYVVLSVVVLQQIFRQATLGPALLLGYGLLALSFAFNLANALWLPRLRRTQWWLAGIHVLFDATVTSSWIYFSGTRESLFALLYLIQILFNALILYQKGALASSVVSCAMFGLVTWLSADPAGAVAWGAYSALFLTLGLIGGYLSEELLRTTESLKDKSRKIEKLVDLHERIIADLPTGLLTVDSEMKVNFINPAGAHILGRAAGEIVGKRLEEVEPGLLPFFSQIDAVEIAEDEEEAIAEPKAEGSSGGHVVEHHRLLFVKPKSEKGTTRLQQTVEVGRGKQRRTLRGDVAELDPDAGLSRLLDSEATGGRVLLFQDVTKLVNLEEKLKQNEKLAAVGQLAAGIAHEIRNPLASMSASIEMLKGSLPANREHAENQKLMEIAIREIDRLNRLVSEFLDFVKPEKFRFESVDLGSMLAEIVLVLKGSRDFKDRVRIEETFATGVVALANGEKLKQVALNLLVNAVQAMPRPGKILVGCDVVSDQRVRFWVEDEGQGMSEEVLSHLYEPFFTTKDKGTGLGLATAYKIIEAHHGEIKVASTIGVGTRFEIYLQSA